MKKAQRLLIATGLGLAASVAMFVYFNGANQRAEGAEPQASVLIAKTSLAANDRVVPEQLAVETRPVKFIPAGAISNPDLAVGRILKSEVATGEPLLEAKLLAPGEEAKTVLPVPPGMRAITVAVDEVVGVAGFVQPGMIVDVISTMDIDGQATTKFLLQKVKVLACAQDSKKKDDPEAKIVSSATLAVTPVDAERLILAADRGKIRLAMRDPKETASAQTLGATPESILGVVKKPSVPAAKPHQVTKIVKVMVPVRSPENAPQIMIIRGTSTEMVNR